MSEFHPLSAASPTRTIELTIDDRPVRVPEGATLLEACSGAGIETPTLCYLSSLTPANACRLCVVELEGSRALVPACSRTAEEAMVVHTDSERVRHSRKMVLEFLASAVDLAVAPDLAGYMERYGADAGRYGASARTAAQPVRIDNGLYVRDYSKCVLCYRCVEACGTDAQNTFAIAVAGRGFGAGIATEFEVPLPDSACVYCGNCIGVCPTGALMFSSEYEMRRDGTWNARSQTQTDTICSYCGVGCTLTLHVQENRIVKVTSPADRGVADGSLCVKGRFGSAYVQRREDDPVR